MPKRSIFLGRQKELSKLKQLFNKKSASLVAITGRRRIGKSTLIEKFATGVRLLRFSGIPPEKQVTAQDQRDIFSQQLGNQCNLPGLKSDDWASLFSLLAKQTHTRRVIILLDEISWMGSKDPTFLGKLKNAWDIEFSKNPELILILCGSVSTWIEKNIISSTGYLGRITQILKLEELPLSDCNELLNQLGFRHTAHEKLKILAVTGGVPWYIEQIQGVHSADNNIKHLCFEKDALLVNEFDLLFHDLFEKRDQLYKTIIKSLQKNALTLEEIATKINYTKSGALSEYLEDLVTSGFLSRDYTWSLKTGKLVRLSHFRLRDNYCRFYLKYIEKNLHRIQQNNFENVNLSDLTGWESCIALQFENLVMSNRKLIQAALKIEPNNIVFDNPFFQTQTARQKGVQIDYLIQTRFNVSYLCEIKFSRNSLKATVVDEVKEKINRLALPRNHTIIPVLIHVNGIDETIEEADFFAAIIDFTEFLT